MSNPAALSQLAYIDETTQGTPPADAAAWVAGGTQIRHIAESLDLSGIKASSVEDMRSQTTLQGTERRLIGIDNPEFPFTMYGHGMGAATADGVQAASIPLVATLGHALGGHRRTYTHAVSGGSSTTTTIDVDDASDWQVGDFIAIELGTAPAGYPSGTAFPRRILTIDTGATPDQITIDQALPAAPEDGDVIHATSFAYVDEDVIVDSNGSGGPYTRTYLGQKGLQSATGSLREAWEIRGAVTQLQAFGFERDQPLQLPFQVMGGSHAAPGTAPWPSWTATPAGFAPLVAGPLTQLWLVDEATTTSTLVHNATFQCEPGVPRTRTEVLTSDNVYMQATSNFGSEPAETTINLALDPFDTSRWGEWESSSYKTMRIARLGNAGFGFFVHFSRVSYVEEPGRGENGWASSTEIQFKAHPDADISPMPANAAIWRSKIIIGVY